MYLGLVPSRRQPQEGHLPETTRRTNTRYVLAPPSYTKGVYEATVEDPAPFSVQYFYLVSILHWTLLGFKGTPLQKKHLKPRNLESTSSWESRSQNSAPNAWNACDSRRTENLAGGPATAQAAATNSVDLPEQQLTLLAPPLENLE